MSLPVDAWNLATLILIWVLVGFLACGCLSIVITRIKKDGRYKTVQKKQDA